MNEKVWQAAGRIAEADCLFMAGKAIVSLADHQDWRVIQKQEIRYD